MNDNEYEIHFHEAKYLKLANRIPEAINEALIAEKLCYQFILKTGKSVRASYLPVIHYFLCALYYSVLDYKNVVQYYQLMIEGSPSFLDTSNSDKLYNSYYQLLLTTNYKSEDYISDEQQAQLLLSTYQYLYNVQNITVQINIVTSDPKNALQIRALEEGHTIYALHLHCQEFSHDLWKAISKSTTIRYLQVSCGAYTHEQISSCISYMAQMKGLIRLFIYNSDLLFSKAQEITEKIPTLLSLQIGPDAERNQALVNRCHDANTAIHTTAALTTLPKLSFEQLLWMSSPENFLINNINLPDFKAPQNALMHIIDLINNDLIWIVYKHLNRSANHFSIPNELVKLIVECLAHIEKLEVISKFMPASPPIKQHL